MENNLKIDEKVLGKFSEKIMSMVTIEKMKSEDAIPQERRKKKYRAKEKPLTLDQV